MVDTVNNIDNINAVIEEVFNDSLLEKKKIDFQNEIDFQKKKELFQKEKELFQKDKELFQKEKELFNKLKNNDTNNEENKNEILLKDEVNRYAIYPLKFSDIYEMYHQQLKCF